MKMRKRRSAKYSPSARRLSLLRTWWRGMRAKDRAAASAAWGKAMSIRLPWGEG